MPHRTPIVSDGREKARTKPMRVLCMGMCRTATTSLREALTQLGFTPYHMLDALQSARRDLNFWSRIAEEKYGSDGTHIDQKELDQILGNYDAVLDLPSCIFIEELMDIYPDTKIILTKRDPHKWVASMNRTILIFNDSVLAKILRRLDPDVIQPLGRFLENYGKYFLKGDRGEIATRAYSDYYEYLRKVVPEERLLLFDEPYDWKPLCEFLEIPVPETEYPFLNRTENFNMIVKMLHSQAIARVVKRWVPWAVSFLAVSTAAHLLYT